MIARVAVPKKLTKEQKHLLEELATTLPQEKLDGDGGRRREAVLRTRQRHLWLATIPRSISGSPPGRAPALSQDLLYAELDDFEPVAIQEHEAGDGWRVFFRTPRQRDAARAARSPRRSAIALLDARRRSTSTTRTGRGGARRR